MLFPRVLGCAVFVIVGLTRPATAELIGPSFDCHSAQQPLAQILCSDPDLSRTDLRFAQAYFALLKQVGDAGKRELKQEDLQFLEAVQRQCKIPPSGQAAPQSEASRNCVKNAYEAQRAVWVLRLTSPFSEEANRSIERHAALQRLLQQLGLLPANAVIDGVYGGATREAISRWQSAQGRNVTGVLGDADAQAIEQQASGIKATTEENQSASSQRREPSPDKLAEQPSASVGAATTERSPSPQRPSEPVRSSSVGTTAAQLTDTDPLRFVDELLDRQSYETLLLGDIVVYGGRFGERVQPPPGNNITGAQYSRYKQWANVGTINIRSEGSTSQRLQQSFSWNDWMSMANGDQERITVIPPHKANENVETLPNTLKIRMGKFKTENVVKNEERIMGVSKYNILMGTYIVNWTPTFQNFCQVNNACTLADKGKFQVLLKFDEFTDRWNIVTWDFADINHEFTTQNVDQQVRLLH
jgi:peptidoglycan hydrolase-like protein with peptidoglycan-binding domain